MPYEIDKNICPINVPCFGNYESRNIGDISSKAVGRELMLVAEIMFFHLHKIFHGIGCFESPVLLVGHPRELFDE